MKNTTNTELAEELKELAESLLNGDIVLSKSKNTKRKVPFTINRDPRKIEDGMLWNGERVEVSMETC